jgi:hypothetical protein
MTRRLTKSWGEPANYTHVSRHEASLFNQIRKAHGLSGVGGEIISGAAREGRIGELVSSDCTQGLTSLHRNDIGRAKRDRPIQIGFVRLFIASSRHSPI